MDLVEDVIILKETDFIHSYGMLYDKNIFLKLNNSTNSNFQFFKLMIEYDKSFTVKNCKIILFVLMGETYVNFISEEREDFFDRGGDKNLDEKVKSIIDEYIEIIKKI